MNPFNLESKTILVTGASSGIGEQAAISIANSGAKVILSARNKEKLETIKSNLKGEGHQLANRRSHHRLRPRRNEPMNRRHRIR